MLPPFERWILTFRVHAGSTRDDLLSSFPGIEFDSMSDEGENNEKNSLYILNTDRISQHCDGSRVGGESTLQEGSERRG